MKANKEKWKYTPKERERYVAGFKKSGLSLRRFAREKNIPPETLRCWVIGKYKVSPVNHGPQKKNAKK